MRFAVSRVTKAIAIGALGCALAFLVACGDRNGLLPDEQASSLNSALDGVAAACSQGNVDDAVAAAQQFERRVDGLSAQTVDKRLLRELRRGGTTLEQLIAGSCTTVAETLPTVTEPTPATPTTVEPPPATTPTTPDGGGTPTTPDGGGGTPTTPDSGGGAPTTPDTGGGDTTGGGTPDTGLGGGSTPGTGDNVPDVNRNNPGGALAPGQGGSTP